MTGVATLTSAFSAPTLTRAAALSDYDDLIPFGDGKGDSQLQRWSSLIGIITAIVGNILISFALNIQRYAHIRLHDERVLRKEKSKSSSKASQDNYGAISRNGSQQADENDLSSPDGHDPLSDSFLSTDSQPLGDGHGRRSTYLKSPYWWGGIVLMTVGEAGNFLAYGFAPASIVSPLGVVALISNCVIAPFMLKEQFRLRDFWGVVIAVAGAVTVVLSAKQEEKKLGPHQVLDAITRTGFEVYMVVTIILIAALVWASPRYGNKTILVDLGLVGLFGGYTALSTKGVASMLSYTLWRAFTTPVTYVLIVVLFGTAVMQVKYVNKALQRFDSTQVIPVQFVMFTLSVIIGSAILFRDFEKATAGNLIKFIFGCLLTFFGVYLITSGRESHSDEDDVEESDEECEARIGLSDHDASRTEERYSGPISKGSEITRKDAPFQHGGDSAEDRNESISRRSSRISFAEPSPLPPRASRMYSTSSLRLNTATSEETPLLVNPWKNSSDELLAARHPGIRGTTSSPVLPSEAQTSTSDAPKPTNHKPSAHDTIHSYPNLQQGPQPPLADRPYTPVRHSISRIMPGPLISPLSGGLSVVVADSLRRGIESPIRSRPIKRARHALRGSKSRSSRGDVLETTLGTSPPEESDSTPVSQSLQEERSSWSGVTRTRSLSNTLGDLFRGKRQKTDKSDTADEESGPSGS
ncbi:magnesium transporter NIPA-domain-containing protein [Bisporella sp. PMI_857]|nr:magnesium transporter NIPA-domain-containing protein [Bisporella sp. PMI_857]